jgi:hypothetical protein
MVRWQRFPQRNGLIERRFIVGCPEFSTHACSLPPDNPFALLSDKLLAYMFSDNGMSDFELHGHNLRRELDRFKTLFLDGHISQDEYEEQARRITADLEKLKPGSHPEAQAILPLLGDFPALWAQMTPLEQRTILRDVFSGLYFDGKGTLREARPHAALKELMM